MRSKPVALKTIFYVKLLLVLLFFCVGIALQAQQKTRPQLNLRVTKQFNDKGNLLSQNKVYTWVYNSGTVPAQPYSSRNNYLMQGDLFKYNDSLWRSVLQPAYFINSIHWQLIQSMQEAVKHLPQQKNTSKQYNFPNPGGKKAVAKVRRDITL